MILKGRKSPSRNPEQGAHLSRKGNPSPNLCLKGMEGSQGDPLHASHPCTREMPTARLSQTCSPDPRKTDPGKTEEGLSCLSKGWHRGKALGQAEMDPTTPWEGSRNPHNTQTIHHLSQTTHWHPCSWPQHRGVTSPRSTPPHGREHGPLQCREQGWLPIPKGKPCYQKH